MFFQFPVDHIEGGEVVAVWPLAFQVDVYVYIGGGGNDHIGINKAIDCRQNILMTGDII